MIVFRDLKGIPDTMEEMKANMTEDDDWTRKIFKTVQRDAPTMRLLEDEDHPKKGQDHAMHNLTQIVAFGDMVCCSYYAPVGLFRVIPAVANVSHLP